MRRCSVMLAVALAFSGVTGLSGFSPAVTPEDELAAIVKSFVGLSQPADWSAIERLPTIRWAPLPPAMLQNCAPDGGCFARQGAATIGGRQVSVMATGARTMVFNVYLRNGGAPFGEAGVLRALQAASLTTSLVRCPIRGSRGSTNWYRLGGDRVEPAHLSIQPANGRGTGEGFALSAGADLPRLQPNQLALYSQQCAPGATQRAVATARPHEELARAVTAMLTPSGGVVAYDWKALAALPTGVVWDSAGVKRVDLSYRNDRNPNSLNGSVEYGGRQFSVMASGTATQVKVIYLDEMGLHPRGEHMLGVVYQQGITVQLHHCGPVYTESTNNWYSLSSAKTRPAMIRQSIRYDGNQVQDAYELRLDGSLPARDPRDRNPGVSGCQ